MGRFSVQVELANHHDEVLAGAGHLDPGSVRHTTISGVVDTGAARLVLPASAVRQLGLASTGQAGVRFADGRMALRDVVTDVRLTYGERSGLFTAIVEPGRDDALIGAIVMEDLDLVPDCTRQTLTPRDPERIISEIE